MVRVKSLIGGIFQEQSLPSRCWNSGFRESLLAYWHCTQMHSEGIWQLTNRRQVCCSIHAEVYNHQEAFFEPIHLTQISKYVDVTPDVAEPATGQDNVRLFEQTQSTIL